MPPIHFALAGYGRVAPTHLDAIKHLGPEAQLLAICDPKPAALKQGVDASGAQGYPRLADMLRHPDIDIVSICTPSGLHAEHGILAARAGKHVLVEKPMDVSLEAAQSLIDECKTAGVELFCVFQNRLNTTLQLVKAAIDADRFGKIYAINSTVIWKRTQEYYDSDPWRGTQALDGGAFLNQGIHFIDAMRFLVGEVTEVKSMLGTLARDIESEDTGSALLRFENGALGNIFVTMLGQSDQEGSLTLLGEKGTVRIGGVALNSIESWEFEEPNEEQDALAKNVDYHTQSVYGFGHQAYYRQVADYLQHNGPRPTSGADGIQSLSVIRRIYQP
jgi:UDP-N-acetyl-2-amino-2-deoxyglucuronate dehydrogenase